MTSNEFINRRDAERLLTGAGPRDPHTDLASVLAAAAQPATANELASTDLVSYQFRVERLRPARRTNALTKAAVANAFAAKFLVAAVAASAAGGVALAAANEMLPGPLQGAAHKVFNAPASHGKGAGHGRPGSSSSPSKDGSTPSPNLEGLCNAFRAHPADNDGKWLQSSAFQVLVKAAGGDDLATVEGYCVTLIGPAPSKTNGRPTGLPSAHPSSTPAKPSSAPGKPTASPGKPTTEPAEPSGSPEPTVEPTQGGEPTDHGRPSDAGKPSRTGQPSGAGQPTRTNKTH